MARPRARPTPRPLDLHCRQLPLPRLGRDLAAAAAPHLDVVQGPGGRAAAAARERRELALLLAVVMPPVLLLALQLKRTSIDISLKRSPSLFT